MRSVQACMAQGNSTLKAGATQGGISGGFISVQGGTFVDQDCSEFLAMGWNR